MTIPQNKHDFSLMELDDFSIHMGGVSQDASADVSDVVMRSKESETWTQREVTLRVAQVINSLLMTYGAPSHTLIYEYF